MKSKIGAVQWTVSKVIMIVLLLVLLAVLLAVIPGQIVTLQENAGGFMDRVSLLLGRNEQLGMCRTIDSPIRIGVGHSEEIPGKIMVCPDNCSFDIGGDNLLGANKFHLTDRGYRASFIGFDYLSSVPSWGESYGDSVKYREAYGELIEVFENFYIQENEGLTRDEFFSTLGFDPGAYFTIYVKHSDDRLSRYNSPEYYFNGEDWFQTLGNIPIRYNLFDQIWNFYIRGSDIAWNYRGENFRRVPVTGNLVDFETVFNEMEFEAWLRDKKASVDDSGNNINEFFLVTGDTPEINRYYYKDGRWKKNRILWFKANADENVIFEEIIEKNRDSQRIVWRYNVNRSNQWHVPIYDTPVFSREDREVAFRIWLDKTQQKYIEDKKLQEDLLVNFDRYFGRDRSVNFEGQNYRVITDSFIDSEGLGKLLIYFVDKNGVRYGMYHNGDELVLTYGDSYRDCRIQDSLAFDEAKWQEFLKINKIFEELRDRCSV